MNNTKRYLVALASIPLFIVVVALVFPAAAGSAIFAAVRAGSKAAFDVFSCEFAAPFMQSMRLYRADFRPQVASEDKPLIEEPDTEGSAEEEPEYIYPPRQTLADFLRIDSFEFNYPGGGGDWNGFLAIVRDPRGIKVRLRHFPAAKWNGERDQGWHVEQGEGPDHWSDQCTLDLIEGYAERCSVLLIDDKFSETLHNMLMTRERLFLAEREAEKIRTEIALPAREVSATTHKKPRRI